MEQKEEKKNCFDLKKNVFVEEIKNCNLMGFELCLKEISKIFFF